MGTAILETPNRESTYQPFHQNIRLFIRQVITNRQVEKSTLLNNTDIIKEINLCIEKIEELPLCYNQAFITGSLRYFERIYRKLNPTMPVHNEVKQLIKQWVNDTKSLIDSVKQDSADPFSTGFCKINLQSYKDRFATIEDRSSGLNIFPRLRDLKVSDLAS